MPRKTKRGKRNSRGGGNGSSNRSEGQETQKQPSGLIEWAKSIAVAVVLFLVLRTFIVQTFVITSGSMMDTLLVGDFLVVNRAALGSQVPFLGARIPGYSEPRRFDVLVFDPPHEDFMLVKRLIGMPGDTLEMKDQQLFINGEAIEEAYVRHEPVADQADGLMGWQAGHLTSEVDPSSYRPTRDTWGPIVIPDGRYFMLGDNRETSYDSRYWGLLERWRLEGRASFIYFSYDRESFKPVPPVTATRLGRVGRVIR